MNLLLLLLLEFLYVSTAIIFLYKLKPKFGLSLLFIFIGANQYLQTILSSAFYIQIGFLSFSPGSVILFSSSLFAVLLVYLEDGVDATRTLIYGIVIANLSLTVLSLISYTQFKDLPISTTHLAISPLLFKINLRSFFVGTAALIFDSVSLIIVFDYIRYRIKFLPLFLQIFLSLFTILSLDSVIYTTGIHFGGANYFDILLNQFICKSFSALFFSIVLYIYLSIFNKDWKIKETAEISPNIDIFSILTYRKKYKELKIESDIKLNQKLEEITTLNSIFRHISSSMSIDAFVKTMLAELDKNLTPDLVLFFKTGNSNLELIGIGPENSKYKLESLQPHKVGQCLCGLAVSLKYPQYSLNINEDKHCSVNDCKYVGIHSFVSLPLVSGNVVIGVIGIASATERDFRLESSFLETLAVQATIALSNSMLYDDLQNKTDRLLHEVADRKRAENKVKESERRYFSLFNNSPISIWEEDFSECLKYLNGLVEKSNKNIAEILDDDNQVMKCSSLVKILDVNEITLSIYKANSKNELLTNLSSIFVPESLKVFRQGLLALYNGVTIFEAEAINKTLTGKKINVFIKWNIERSSNNLNTKVIVSLIDITEEKKVEEKLHIEHNRITNILESMSDAFVSIDENWCYSYMNEKAGKIFNRNPKEMIGKHIWTEFPEGRNQPFYLNYEKVMKEKVFIKMEEYYPPYDKWFENRINPTKDGIAIFFTDITERKKAEEKVSLLNQQLLKAEEIAHFGFLDWDLLTNKIYLSPEINRLYGIPEEALNVAEFINKAVHPDDLNFVNENLDLAIKGIKEYNIDHRIIRPNGEIIWLNNQAEITKDKNGKPIRVLGTVFDITNQKLAEIRAKRLSRIFEESLNEIYLFDADTLIFTQVNEAAQHNLGYTMDELKKLTPLDIKPEFTYQTFTKLLEPLRTGKEDIIVFETVHKRKDQSQYYAEAHVQLLHFEQETMFAAIVMDITESKKVEAELLKSGERYKALITVSNTGAWEYNLDTDFLWCSPEYFSMLGYDIDQFDLSGVSNLKETWIDLLHPDDSQEASKHFSEYLQNGSVGMYENYFRMKHKDGHWVWILSRGSTLKNKNGEITSITVGTHIDISDSKIAEKKLKESESRYRNIVENSHDGIAIIDDNYEMLYANEELVNIFGYPHNEIIGAKIEKFLTEESKDFVLDRYRRRQNGENLPTAYNITIKQKLGAIRDVKISASVITTSGGKKNTIAQLLDITEEKYAQKALIASENKFRTVVEQAGDAMILVDFEGNLIDFNKKAYQELGYTREELKKMNLKNIVENFETNNELENTFKNFKLNQTIILQRNYMRKDGTKFPAEITVGLIDINGKILILGFARDITEREKDKAKLKSYRDNLEELVQKRTIQLEEANKELESFSYSVSHDLRAPLRHINGFIELLAINSSSKLDAKSVHYIQTISHASEQMGQLIDELLDFSRMGRKDMISSELNIEELIILVKNELLLDLKNTHRNIEWTIEEMPKVFGDRSMLKTVFVNLISNAIKYTSKKGNAIIKIRCDLNEKKEFVFCIEDNGAGFDMRFADKLFGVFQRLHSQKEFEGTGIGLASVRRIISRHNGKTWAKGEVDKGAKFYFSLPKSIE